MKLFIEESVLRQALEAYDHINETGLKPSVCAGVQRAFHALRSALDAAEKVEPVAWVKLNDESDFTFQKPVSEAGYLKLYTNPAPTVPEE